MRRKIKGMGFEPARGQVTKRDALCNQNLGGYSHQLMGWLLKQFPWRPTGGLTGCPPCYLFPCLASLDSVNIPQEPGCIVLKSSCLVNARNSPQQKIKIRFQMLGNLLRIQSLSYTGLH